MNAPDEIPESLRLAGITPPGIEGEDLAWNKADALAVVESLRGTRVAITGGDVYSLVSWGCLPTGEAWECDRLHLEDSLAYARRSRDAAMAFIQSHAVDREGDFLYVLIFSRQDTAA